MNEYKAVKIALIGSAGIGKSSLGHYLTNQGFDREYVSTIGVDMMNAYVHNEKFKISFWDLAGLERFQGIIESFINTSDCLAFCFSVYDPLSVDQMKKRYAYCKEKKMLENKRIIVVALKTDLEHRCLDMGLHFANKHGFTFFTTSSLKKEGKKEIFDHLSSVYNKRGFEVEEPGDLRIYVEEPKFTCPSCCVM
jgi:small GTP-binding protein